MATHQKRMHKHFSKIAPSYRHLRTTDLDPVQIISQKLRNLTSTIAADIGCGDGRYDLLFFKQLNNLYLICIDNNETMLKQASDYLRSNGIHNFMTMKANATDFPLKNGKIDSIFSFNAVHHFDFQRFVERAAEVTKNGGLIFIYTRLRSQNLRNIWGRYFPLFSEKENRLYEFNDIIEIVDSINYVDIESIKSFKFKRKANLEQLIEKVKSRHYSTFSLYEEDELEETLKTFQENIIRKFKDTNKIEWVDENILLTLNVK